MPSSLVPGHSAPHPGHTGAQYGSPLKRPSIGWSLPDAVALEVTAMSLMRMAIASPTSAPSTATGRHTSWPPRMDGVIIGPQQPGVEFQTMWPPSRTGPSIATSGPSSPSVNVSTNTVARASVVVAGLCSWMVMCAPRCGRTSAAGDGQQEGDFLAVGQRAVARRVLSVDDPQRRPQGGREVRLGLPEAAEEVLARGAVGETHAEERGRRQPAQPAAQTDTHTHSRCFPPPLAGLGTAYPPAAPPASAQASATRSVRSRPRYVPQN